LLPDLSGLVGGLDRRSTHRFPGLGAHAPGLIRSAAGQVFGLSAEAFALLLGLVGEALAGLFGTFANVFAGTGSPFGQVFPYTGRHALGLVGQAAQSATGLL
jgi:hypothetical protein